MLRPTLLPVAMLLTLSACGGDEKPAKVENAKATKTASKPAAYEPQQEPLVGGPYPTLLLSQAWFLTGTDGKPKPGPARLEIWRKGPGGWVSTRLEDPDSNVFHKAILNKDAALMEKALQHTMVVVVVCFFAGNPAQSRRVFCGPSAIVVAQ